MVDVVRGVLNVFILDVYIFIDYYVGLEVGKSLGYGLFFVVEIIMGCVFGVDVVFMVCVFVMSEVVDLEWVDDVEARVFEDVGRRVVEVFVVEI